MTFTLICGETVKKKVIFEKTYHGFEAVCDIDRDITEALDPGFNENMKQIPGEFQGRLKVLITYEPE